MAALIKILFLIFILFLNGCSNAKGIYADYILDIPNSPSSEVSAAKKRGFSANINALIY